jgi:tripeptide aminopeptidase
VHSGWNAFVLLTWLKAMQKGMVAVMVNKNRIAEEFCRLVEIDSLSFGEREMADVLKKALTDLGFTVQEDGAGSYYGGNCGNVYGFLEGTIAGEPLLFSAHMDTVGPGLNKRAVMHQDGRITSDGSTVLGADDISGIVAILEAVRTIKEQGLAHRSIEVLFTVAEEVYIRGSEVYDFSNIKAREAYVLDLSGPVGTAALAAPTLVSFTATITGKASHAGFAPELGINAIAVTAQAISKIRQGRIDQDTTVNIGLIEGGKARNIVPDQCVLKGEVRSLFHDMALSETNRIEDILRKEATLHHAGLEFATEFGCLAYQVDREHPVVRRFETVCEELGYRSEYTTTFGGSDNNNFLRHGITGIVLACGMNQVHSCSEYTHIEELVKCSDIILKLMTGKDQGI